MLRYSKINEINMTKLALLLIALLGASWTSNGPGVSGSITFSATIAPTVSLSADAVAIGNDQFEVTVIASSTGFPEPVSISKKYIIDGDHEDIFVAFDGRNVDMMTATAYAKLFKERPSSR